MHMPIARRAMSRLPARMRLLPVVALLAMGGPMAAPAFAQDEPKDAASISEEVSDDRGFLTRFLERNLSSAGREVRITGFEGALSSRATFDEITITDKDGAWITLKNGAIAWNRGALLARRVEIAELSAETISLPRLPRTEDAGPKVEARSFSLPQLPVAVDIQRISAQRVELGEPIIGEAAAVSIDGAMSLKGGEGAAKLAINRVDGKRGVFAVDVGYSNDTTVLRIDTTLDEDAGGIFANLVKLEGRPAVKAEIKGQGPITDFAADIALATSGQPRVTGKVSLKAEAGPDGAPGHGFRVRLGGDVAALVPEGQRAFFGSQSQFLAEGWRGDDGQLSVPVLLIDTEGLNVSGSFAANAQGAPTSAVLMVTLGADAGATQLPVRLPVRGAPTTVNSGRLQLTYDAAESAAWTLNGHLDEFAQGTLRIGTVDLDGGGTVGLQNGALTQLDGRVTFDTQGIAPSDPGLAAAIGTSLKGATRFDWTPGSAVSLAGLDITGMDYGLKGDLTIDGLTSGITVSGEIDARYDDLSRLAALAGRPVTGKATGTVSGHYTLLSRAFNAEAKLATTNLTTGQPQLDRLLAGDTAIIASAGRDETGIELRQLTVNGQRLTADASGTISSESSDLRATLKLASLAEVDPAFGGSLEAEATLTGGGGAREITLNGQAMDLSTGIAALDGVLKGKTDLALLAQQADGAVTLKTLRLANPQVTIEGQGDLTPGQIDATLEVSMADLSAVSPAWAGSLTASGRVVEDAGARKLSMTGTGEGLRFGQQDADAALTGTTRFALDATQRGDQAQIDRLEVTNDQLTASVSGPVGRDATDLSGRAEIKSLAAFGRGWDGAIAAQGSFRDDGQGGRQLDVTGTAQDLSLGRAEVDGALSGTTSFAIKGTEKDGTFTIADANIRNEQAEVTASGMVGKAGTDLTGHAVVARLEDLGRGWRGALDLTGRYADDGKGARSMDVTGTGQDLALGQAQVDGALTGTTRLAIKATQGTGGFVIDTATLTNDQARITAQGKVAPDDTNLTGTAKITSLAPFKPGWGGSLDLTGSFKDDGSGARRLQVQGTAQDLALGQPQLDGALQGTTNLDVRAVERDGVFTIEAAELANPQASVTATGTIGKGATEARARLVMPSLAPLGAGYGGAIEADATLNDDGTGARRFTVSGTGTDLSLGQTQVDAALSGATRFDIAGTERGGVITLDRAVIDNPRLNAKATGTVGGGVTDLKAELRADSLAFLGRGLRGGLTANTEVRQQGGTLQITASGEGRNLGIGNPTADALLGGTTRFDLAATRKGDDLTIQRLAASNPQLSLQAEGALASGIQLNARLADLGLLVPGFPGPATAQGTVRRNGTQLGLDLDVTGPGGTTASITGTAAQDFSTVDLRANGTTDAAVANPFLRVRSVEGPVNFDLRLNGRPSLQALTGQINVPSARLSDPKLGLRIEALRLNATLGGGGISVDGGGNLADGGSLSVNGRIGLEGARPVDLTIRLNEAAIRDPNLYQTAATGILTVSGTLAAGPLIAGRLTLDRTEIRIPSTGLGGAKDIPQITHLGDRPPVRSTRAKAGLTPYPGVESREAGLAGPPATPPAVVARLDITIDAPNQVFLRGRGVDAEFGGTIRLTGDARKIVPIGYLQLIRGRVDLLGKRFELTEGLLELEGRLVPVLRLVAETQQDGIVTRIGIEGEATDPTITFTSVPDLPQEEVLSQLLFGRGLDNISALQAAQLANAVAVLAGRGGEGIVSKLRNQIGLDDLDLATDDEGNVTVRAGKYITDKLYTDVAVGGDGKTKLNLNLDVTKELTARGSVDNEGSSTLGLYYERDF